MVYQCMESMGNAEQLKRKEMLEKIKEKSKRIVRGDEELDGFGYYIKDSEVYELEKELGGDG